MKLKLWLQSATAAGAIFATAGMAFSEGMLRYATVGEPPSLDQHVITSDLATTIAHHMFEGLYTFNAANEPVGLLAAGETLRMTARSSRLHCATTLIFTTAST